MQLYASHHTYAPLYQVHWLTFTNILDSDFYFPSAKRREMKKRREKILFTTSSTRMDLLVLQLQITLMVKVKSPRIKIDIYMHIKKEHTKPMQCVMVILITSVHLPNRAAGPTRGCLPALTDFLFFFLLSLLQHIFFVRFLHSFLFHMLCDVLWDCERKKYYGVIFPFASYSLYLFFPCHCCTRVTRYQVMFKARVISILHAYYSLPPILWVSLVCEASRNVCA